MEHRENTTGQGNTPQPSTALRSLAVTYLVTGFIELALILVAVLVLAYIIAIWSFDPGRTGQPGSTAELALYGLALACYPLPSIASGFGLLRGARWSYKLAWAATVLHAVLFPIGTAIAAFGAVMLLKPEVRQRFL